MVYGDYLRRRIAPLQRRARAAWEYIGPEDYMRTHQGVRWDWAPEDFKILIQRVLNLNSVEASLIPHGILPLCSDPDRVSILTIMTAVGASEEQAPKGHGGAEESALRLREDALAERERALEESEAATQRLADSLSLREAAQEEQARRNLECIRAERAALEQQAANLEAREKELDARKRSGGAATGESDLVARLAAAEHNVADMQRALDSSTGEAEALRLSGEIGPGMLWDAVSRLDRAGREAGLWKGQTISRSTNLEGLAPHLRRMAWAVQQLPEELEKTIKSSSRDLAQGAVELVLASFTITDTPLTEIDHHNLQLNAQAMNALFNSLSQEEFDRVSNLKTAYEIWNKLAEIHEGTSEYKDAKLHFLKIQYETFSMLPHESVNDMYGRLNVIVNDLKGLGANYIDLEVAQKMLRPLPEKYETLVTMLINSDMSRMTLASLLGKINTNDMYKLKKEEMKEASPSKKCIALQAEVEDKGKGKDDDEDKSSKKKSGGYKLRKKLKKEGKKIEAFIGE
ncbi:uncharacterized protein [Oryza sativa Japonica Group]|uniref:uncharacterized protein n=1 Tax=Oryza sativa subsp. japonica TaxID=39947 RepID=UPI00339C34E2